MTHEEQKRMDEMKMRREQLAYSQREVERLELQISAARLELEKMQCLREKYLCDCSRLEATLDSLSKKEAAGGV